MISVDTEIKGFAVTGQGFKAPVVREWLSTSEAAAIASVDQSTVIRWCQRFGTSLARRVRGRWRIKPEALAKILEGEDLGATKDRK